MSDVTLGDRTITVRELTVGQIRAWMKALDTAGQDSFDTVNAMLYEDCDVETILEMTNLSAETVDELLPSELREVVRECQHVNSHFFGMARRMGLLLEQVDQLDQTGQNGESASLKPTAQPS